MVRRTRLDSSSGVNLRPGERHGPVAAHVPFEQGRAAFRMQHLQLLGGPAHQQLAILVDADDRWRQRLAEGVGQNARPIIFEQGRG